jgi:charged multivesicular body protein 6
LVEKQVFDGLSAGNQVLKELHSEMSIADVEKLMDETAENIAYQNEIDELLSSRLSVAEEEDIERELDEMVVSTIEPCLAARDLAFTLLTLGELYIEWIYRAPYFLLYPWDCLKAKPYTNNNPNSNKKVFDCD